MDQNKKTEIKPIQWNRLKRKKSPGYGSKRRVGLPRIVSIIDISSSSYSYPMSSDSHLDKVQRSDVCKLQLTHIKTNRLFAINSCNDFIVVSNKPNTQIEALLF